jgi:hypothetical protein
MGNILSRQPLGLWRDALEGHDVQARNTLTDADGQTLTPDRSFYAERQRQAIARLADKGII